MLTLCFRVDNPSFPCVQRQLRVAVGGGGSPSLRWNEGGIDSKLIKNK